MTALQDVRVLAEGLAFPEGPVAMADGSVLVVEIRAGTLTRIGPDGGTTVVADVGGGPNGAARGPDGAIYICNNSGVPGCTRGTASIQRVDLDTGDVSFLYTECDGAPFGRPNDLVFDRTGNFWFTDLEAGSVFYASPTGDAIELAWTDLNSPNGVGLSPDETVLYTAQTRTRQVMRRNVTSPGVLAPSPGFGVRALAREGQINRDLLLAGLPGMQELDSMAVEGSGAVCVATLVDSGITVISPDGSSIEKYELPPELNDPIVTNICFGGADLKTAFITLAWTGRVVSCRWPRPGMRLNFQE